MRQRRRCLRKAQAYNGEPRAAPLAYTRAYPARLQQPMDTPRDGGRDLAPKTAARGCPLFYSDRGRRTATGVDGRNRPCPCCSAACTPRNRHRHTPSSSVCAGPAPCCATPSAYHGALRALPRAGPSPLSKPTRLVWAPPPYAPLQCVFGARPPGRARDRDSSGRQQRKNWRTWGERARARERAPPSTYVSAHPRGPRHPTAGDDMERRGGGG